MAIKVIRNSPKYIKAAKTELHILKQIKSTDTNGSYFCIHVKDSFSWNGHPCFMFKLYGGSVYDVMSKNKFRPFPDLIIRSLAYQICSAVKFLHNLNIIYTDLKPQNMVFVDSRTYEVMHNGENHLIPFNTNIKIIDFGSALYEPDWKYKDGYKYLIQTRHYRAPEVILEIRWKRAVDIWSVGCVLLEFLNGSVIFRT